MTTSADPELARSIQQLEMTYHRGQPGCQLCKNGGELTRNMVAVGPASTRVRSTTLIPAKGRSAWVVESARKLARESEGRAERRAVSRRSMSVFTGIRGSGKSREQIKRRERVIVGKLRLRPCGLCVVLVAVRLNQAQLGYHSSQGRTWPTLAALTDRTPSVPACLRRAGGHRPTTQRHVKRQDGADLDEI